MNNSRLQTTILLLSSLMLFSHQPQAIADLPDLEEPLPILQAGLVAVNNQVQIWPTGLATVLQPAPVLLPPIVKPTLPEVAGIDQPDAEVSPATMITGAAPAPETGALAEARTYWPESATMLARLSQQSEVPASVRQLLNTNACRGCDLRGVNLQNAMLMNADLTEADLSAANLREADLRGAKLSNAILSGTNLSGTIMPDGMLHQ